jgi:hypothetical protein
MLASLGRNARYSWRAAFFFSLLGTVENRSCRRFGGYLPGWLAGKSIGARSVAVYDFCYEKRLLSWPFFT